MNFEKCFLDIQEKFPDHEINDTTKDFMELTWFYVISLMNKNYFMEEGLPIDIAPKDEYVLYFDEYWREGITYGDGVFWNGEEEIHPTHWLPKPINKK